jgi:hypothetical protein
MRLILGVCSLAFFTRLAIAIDVNECEQQRTQYPKNWNDVSHEKVLFDCVSHYAGGIRVKVSATDGDGRTLISLVPLNEGDAGPTEDTSKTIYRIWLDKEQFGRLAGGAYFATILRKETACWIRGDLDGGAVFFMDNSNQPADGLRPGAGSFYNKAPRFSVFQGNAYECRAAN